MIKVFILSVLLSCLLIPDTTAAGWRTRYKAPNQTVKEIRKNAPDDTLFFEEAFPRPEEIKETEKQTGSLWVDSYSSNMYTNLHRASRVGDMVTILIEEIAPGSKTAETKTERKSKHLLSIGGLFGLVKQLTTAINGFDPDKTIDVKHDNKHEGKGETKRKGELQAKLTARVMKVLQNGDMMIRGQKNIKVNNEEQTLVVEGFIRPYDINSDNTIFSTFISDARITFSGFGTVSDKQKPGWLTRILDHILPF
ncbi:MAG: flagellar basal body L-ring protein FlgH [Deltaproteobacteria bacterium]|nr:flagellar basal body L-ring protein FlgH [Deltaproteobacteria bacterium]